MYMQEGIAIGRSFSVTANTPHDGNKEMIAFGLMNLFGSFTSCYLTSGKLIFFFFTLYTKYETWCNYKIVTL